MILTMCQLTIVVVVIVAQSETVLLNTVAKITGNFLRILRFPPQKNPGRKTPGNRMECWNPSFGISGKTWEFEGKVL